MLAVFGNRSYSYSSSISVVSSDFGAEGFGEEEEVELTFNWGISLSPEPNSLFLDLRLLDLWFF